MTKEFSFEKRTTEGKNFQETVVDLSKSIAAYLGLYRDAFNYSQFETEMRGSGRAIIAAIFQDLFGQESLRSLSCEGKKFLGIEILDALEPNAELDV